MGWGGRENAIDRRRGSSYPGWQGTFRKWTTLHDGGKRMLTMLGSPRRCCDGLTRRETLKVGALSLLGGFFNLPDLLALEQSGGISPRRSKARSVILLY